MFRWVCEENQNIANENGKLFKNLVKFRYGKNFNGISDIFVVGAAVIIAQCRFCLRKSVQHEKKQQQQ